MKKIIASVLGLITVALAICSYNSIKRGGISYVIEVVTHPDYQSNPKEQAENEKETIAKCCEILRKRCNYAGAMPEEIYSLEQEGHPNRIKIRLQGVKDTERMKKLFTSSVDLGFWEVYTADEIDPFLKASEDKLRILLSENKQGLTEEHPLSSIFQFNSTDYSYSPIIGYARYQDTATINTYLNMPEIKAELPQNLRLIWSASSSDLDRNGELFELYAIKSTERDGKAPLSEDVIIDAECMNDYYGRPSLSIVMNEEGAHTWANMTRNNIGRAIAIVLNNHVYSAPQVNSAIEGGRSQITGHIVEDKAQYLTCILKSGVMPASVEVIEENIVPNDQWSINKMLLICTIICGLTFVFVLIKAIKDK